MSHPTHVVISDADSMAWCLICHARAVRVRSSGDRSEFIARHRCCAQEPMPHRPDRIIQSLSDRYGTAFAQMARETTLYCAHDAIFVVHRNDPIAAEFGSFSSAWKGWSVDALSLCGFLDATKHRGDAIAIRALLQVRADAGVRIVLCLDGHRLSAVAPPGLMARWMRAQRAGLAHFQPLSLPLN